MAKFRKKPIVIDAMRVPHPTDPLEWGYLAGFMNAGQANWHVAPNANGVIISTLEGEMYANVGDWIIRGVKGEFYPCKPDIFEATYEEAP